MDIQTVTIISGIVFFGVLVVSLVLWFSTIRKPKDGTWKAGLVARMDTISAQINPKDAQSLKLAIMEYDKVLHESLTKLGAKGNTLGEKLKFNASFFSGREHHQAAWDAHKVRNSIAHDLNFSAKPDELLATVSLFRQVIEKLIS